jgi:ribosomal protein S18 acetylase RimI-like enzyme
LAGIWGFEEKPMIQPSLRARLDQHFITAHARLYRSMMGGLFEVTPHWVRGYSGLPLPTFNVFMPLTHAGLTDETLADTAAFYFSMDTVYAVEIVHDRFPHGPDFLTERDYQPLPPQPAMVLTERLRPVQLNPAVMVERVGTVASLAALSSLLNSVFDLPLLEMSRLFSVAHLKEELKNTIRHYLAFMGERPVGVGTVICVNGVASIWNLGTLDEYRRQGVATSLLQRMLTDASDSGYAPAMVYSTPLAYHLFNRLGFDLYAQRQWFLPPELDYEEDESS